MPNLIRAPFSISVFSWAPSLLLYKRDPLVWMMHLLLLINQSKFWVFMIFVNWFSGALVSLLLRLPTTQVSKRNPGRPLYLPIVDAQEPLAGLPFPLLFPCLFASILKFLYYSLTLVWWSCRSLSSHKSRIQGDRHPGQRILGRRSVGSRLGHLGHIY